MYDGRVGNGPGSGRVVNGPSSTPLFNMCNNNCAYIFLFCLWKNGGCKHNMPTYPNKT